MLRKADGRAITYRRYDHLWTRHRQTVAVDADPAAQHLLDTAHHADLGGAEFWLRHLQFCTSERTGDIFMARPLTSLGARSPAD